MSKAAEEFIDSNYHIHPENSDVLYSDKTGLKVDYAEVAQAYADKVRLDTLLEVKTYFDIQSDSSVFCNGYNCLKQIIEKEQLKTK